MTIRDVIDEALSLIDEAENEVDYRERIIRAINHVQAKISKFAKQIKKYVELSTNEKVITLPADFLRLISVEDEAGNFISYRQIDTNKLLFDEEGIYKICYSKILDNFDAKSVQDSEELQIEEVARECLVYGVAAEISMDNEDIYPILQNEYNNLLANLELAVDIPESGNSISHIEGMWY